MIINHNMQSMNTARQLGTVNSAQSKSMEKLSSGYRINRAGDDAAGLAISEKMRGQISGLGQASRNAQDGISLIQTAEGALNETESILQRMRELGVQSANDTNTAADRAEIQKEVNQLTEEIDRIAETTEFNTKKLLNGSMEATSAITTNNSGAVSVDVTDNTLYSGDYTVTVANATVTASDATTHQAGGTGIDAADLSITGTDFSAGSYSLVITNYNSGSNTADVQLNDADGNQIAAVTGAATNAAITIDQLEIATGQITGDGTSSFDTTITADVTVTGPDGVVAVETDVAAGLTDSTLNVAAGFDFVVDSDLTDGADVVSVTNNAASLQIGANEGQSMKVSIGDMSASALGVDSMNVETATDAESAITTIDDAIAAVSAQRSDLGAYQNRLEHTISNLDTSAENLQASESRIRDVDMADEMMEYSKNNILSQAANSMLAQANQSTQSVLQLLG